MAKTYLIHGAAFAAALLLSVSASAETYITTKTEQLHRPGVVYMNFGTLDRNRDGILSANEVGETLFYMFDGDGNEVIDNIEYEQGKVYTVEPMQTSVTVQSDFDDDGIVDRTQYSADRFMQVTRLDRLNGGEGAKMSPHDFIGQSFLQLDDDDSKAIEVSEWREAYTRTIAYAVSEPERYNN